MTEETPAPNPREGAIRGISDALTLTDRVGDTLLTAMLADCLDVAIKHRFDVPSNQVGHSLDHLPEPKSDAL
ncbi:hypothetical protein H5J25_13935 [Sphingomonas aliaeris]|uniref:Uncharacterized protein n=1 Tax=Sphingomonas aliaeris TaxID=2759526 RepID=A0A974S3H8_9SPHN|nr:hypothetical protein [Sphingomonas aliaeris]QQV76543.1 hypothetical protein H5J25_13935 [Sphingomonas aliaeris]